MFEVAWIIYQYPWLYPLRHASSLIFFSEYISPYFVIVDQLLSCICRECVLWYIFCKCFKALFLNTINHSLVCMIYLLNYFDKIVQTQYVLCCYWIYKEYGDLILNRMQCILLLSDDVMKSFELYFGCT